MTCQGPRARESENSLKQMSEKTFENVSAEVFDRMKTKSAETRGTIYDPPDGNQGTATTKISFIGTIGLGFEFDPEAETVTYRILEKPDLIPEPTIWSGIEEGIQACRD